MKDYTELAKRTINSIIKEADAAKRIRDLKDEQVLPYIYNLSYPEDYTYYLKRAICRMEPFCSWGLSSEELFEKEETYKVLGKMHYASAKKSAGSNATVYAGTWKKHLQGIQEKVHRATLLDFAIVLKLSLSDMLQMLVCFDERACNLHSAEEFLTFYFVAKGTERYTVEYKKKMLKRFQQTDAQSTGMEADEGGYTLMAEDLLSSIQNSTEPDEQQDEQIFEFMVKNKSRFDDSVSATQNASLLFLLRCIFVASGYSEETEYRLRLENSMKSHLDYYTEIKWYKQLLDEICRPFLKASEESKEKLQPQLLEYLEGITLHIKQVENRYSKNNKELVAPVQKQDVLFLSALFFAACMNSIEYLENKIDFKDLPRGTTEKNRKTYDDMIDLPIARTIEELQKKQKYRDWILCSPREYSMKERYCLAEEFLNQMLQCFNYPGVRLSAPMDRLVMMALMSESPYQMLFHILNTRYRKVLPEPKKTGEKKLKTR